MKKTALILLTILILIPCLSGCSEKHEKYTYTDVTLCEWRVFSSDNNEKFSQEPAKNVESYIISLLNEGKWTEELCECANDYKFTIDGKTVEYSTSCGSFYDRDRVKTLELSKEQRTQLNEYLKSMGE